jgi:hypothetical protein
MTCASLCVILTPQMPDSAFDPRVLGGTRVHGDGFVGSRFLSF